MRLFFADLTHTGVGINADVFPLGHWGADNLHHWGKFLQKSNALKIRRRVVAA